MKQQNPQASLLNHRAFINTLCRDHEHPWTFQLQKHIPWIPHASCPQQSPFCLVTGCPEWHCQDWWLNPRALVHISAFPQPSTLNGPRVGEKPARGSWSKCNVQDSTLIQSPLNQTLCSPYFSMRQGKVTSMIYTLLFFKPQLIKHLYDNNKLTFTVPRCLKNCYRLIQVRTWTQSFRKTAAHSNSGQPCDFCSQHSPKPTRDFPTRPKLHTKSRLTHRGTRH